MINTRRTKQVVALAVGLSLVAAACGGDDDESGSEEPAAEEEAAEEPADEPADAEEPAEEAEEPAEEAEEPAEESEEPAEEGEEGEESMDAEEPMGEPAMVLTIDMNPDSVWEDGTPITVADVECSWLAYLNTPGSITTTGYDQILSVEEGESDKQVVITFGTVYAPYRTLFPSILKADMHEDCNDVSLDFEDQLPASARALRIEEWGTGQSILVPNENFWGEPPATDRIVMVPFADQDTEKAALASGEVDFISPQWDPGFAEVVDSNETVELDLRPGAQYEGFYLQSGGEFDPMYEGPFTDPVYREAFYKSIDREAVFQQIYVPIGGEASTILTCGPIIPGPYCDPETAPFQTVYDPEGAAALLEESGWTQDGNGFWVDPETGEVPEVRWIINTGNTRRESTQAFLIPLLAELGFNVVPSNCDAACYFQQRLPALDYDMAQYISVPQPDPSYLTSNWTCDAIPVESNGFAGQNSTGYCNEEVSALLTEADATVDEAARTELVTTALELLSEGYAMFPLFQFPQSHLWRSEKVGPPEAIAANTINYRGFAHNIDEWEDLDGDGQIVIGAEQWPECLNPITECSLSSWYQWTVAFPTTPAFWDSTDSQEFELTELVVGEPTVEVL